MQQRLREREFERTGDVKRFLTESHEKLKSLCYPSSNFNQERERDEDTIDAEMFARGGSVICVGCTKPSLASARLECRHIVCFGCLERNEVRVDGNVSYSCAICNGMSGKIVIL